MFSEINLLVQNRTALYIYDIMCHDDVYVLYMGSEIDKKINK